MNYRANRREAYPPLSILAIESLGPWANNIEHATVILALAFVLLLGLYFTVTLYSDGFKNMY